MLHHRRGGGAERAAEAVRAALAGAALAVPRGGGRLQAGHALGGIVAVALGELLLQVPDAGFERGDQRLRLGNHGERLVQPRIQPRDQVHQFRLRERPHHRPRQRHGAPAYLARPLCRKPLARFTRQCEQLPCRLRRMLSSPRARLRQGSRSRRISGLGSSRWLDGLMLER